MPEFCDCCICALMHADWLRFSGEAKYELTRTESQGAVMVRVVSLKRIIAFGMSCLIVLTGVGMRPAVAAITPSASPGSCGTVLLAGSGWLGGQGVNVMSKGRHQGTESRAAGLVT
jgi:hypothetical protein